MCGGRNEMSRLGWVCVVIALSGLPNTAAHAQTPNRAPDTIAARVLACASCHGARGEGTSDVYFPRLAGKPAGYLYNQLIAFRDGRRRYPPMNFLLEFLPDAYLKEISEYFASLRPPFPQSAVPDVSKDVLARGETLVRSGDPAHGVPPRPALPGPKLGGMGAGDSWPSRLAGQLYQRPARRLALRHAHGDRAR